MPSNEIAHQAKLFREILFQMGENPDREGLKGTPQRVVNSLAFLTSGYGVDPQKILNAAVFNAPDVDEMVVVQDIELYSMCEHHMLPMFGRAHVAYIPSGKIVGLSKIPRIIDVFARRLQVQERLTSQIAEALDEALEPVGVGVVIEAQHLCMMMRGVQKQNSSTTTSCMLGALRDKPAARAEFLSLVRR